MSWAGAAAVEDLGWLRWMRLATCLVVQEVDWRTFLLPQVVEAP